MAFYKMIRLLCKAGWFVRRNWFCSDTGLISSVTEYITLMSEVMSKDVKYYVDGEFCIDDEDYEYYKVEVEIDEEDVIENGELIIEDVSNEEVDDSGVLVYSYKCKYVVMSYDFGGSLCNVEEYNSLNEIEI